MIESVSRRRVEASRHKTAQAQGGLVGFVRLAQQRGTCLLDLGFDTEDRAMRAALASTPLIACSSSGSSAGSADLVPLSAGAARFDSQVHVRLRGQRRRTSLRQRRG